jgi:hypothetical protein
MISMIRWVLSLAVCLSTGVVLAATADDEALAKRLCGALYTSDHEAFVACHARVLSEAAERRALADKLKAWADGVERLPDAELDALPSAAAAAIARYATLSTDLGQPTDPQAARVALDAMTSDAAKEKACRADAKCLNDRAVKRADADFTETVLSPLCGYDEHRAAAAAALARERANPSGFVNKSLMHGYGSDMQFNTEQMKPLLAAFVRAKHRVWRGYVAECGAFR